MAAAFWEVLPNFGFDEQTPTGGPGMVVPYKGLNVVMLNSGKDLKVTTVMKPMLGIYEVKDRHYHAVMVDMQYPSSGPDQVVNLAALKLGDLRVFQITGNSLVGFGRATIQAINPTTRRTEATLKITVLKQKRVKIAIRAARCRDDQGNLVNSSSIPVNADGLLRQMNLIWKPQANIVFELSRTDPVTIDGLRPQSEVDIKNKYLMPAFVAKKDPDAALTFFMVRKALDGNVMVRGVTDTQAGYALIDDSRTDATMAHEAGHYMGSVDDSGKFKMTYGHQGTATNLLMRDGATGHKIPFSIATDFNRGYASHR